MWRDHIEGNRLFAAYIHPSGRELARILARRTSLGYCWKCGSMYGRNDTMSEARQHIESWLDRRRARRL